MTCPRISATPVESPAGWPGLRVIFYGDGRRSASAFSSQNAMAISRYIVVAVVKVKCSSAFAGASALLASDLSRREVQPPQEIVGHANARRMRLPISGCYW
jgi:hypothetical protein